MAAPKAHLAPSNIPPGRPGATYWDYTDDQIWDCLYHKHMGIRPTARELGLDPKTVRDRRRKMMLLIPVEEVEQHRASTDTTLESLVEQQAKIARIALDPDHKRFNLDMAHRALQEIHRITKTRIDLFGLALQPDSEELPDADAINQLFHAYNTGRQDAQQES